MSLRLGSLGLGLLATALCAALALELDGSQTEANPSGIVPIRHVPRTQPRVASEDPEDHAGAWAATALARPLFSRDRKPTPLAAATGGAPALAVLPRLTGVIIGPFGHTAIFAAPAGGRPIAVSEGKTVGPYRIETIAPGGVTVAGPGGERHVPLSEDASMRDALAAEIPRPPPPPPPPGQVGVPGLPAGVAPGMPFNLQQRQNLLNLRPGMLQRAQPGPQNAQPVPQGSN
jgi:hypothetical protein